MKYKYFQILFILQFAHQQDYISHVAFFFLSTHTRRLVKSRSSSSQIPSGEFFSRRSFRCFPMRKGRGGPLSSSTCLSPIKMSRITFRVLCFTTFPDRKKTCTILSLFPLISSLVVLEQLELECFLPAHP